MKNYILYGSSWLLCLILSIPLSAQVDCKPDQDETVITQGEVLFDYGSTTNAFNLRRRSDITVGQPLVGQVLNRANIMEFGFWTRFLLPPSAPTVRATQGDLLDRIRVSWTVDPLSPAPESFNIYRDGVFIEKVGKEIRNYNDFNVIAGVPYNYTVSAVNQYGEGPFGPALGFQVPNGTVTGLVQTASGNPVPDALITLTPMQGFSAKFGPDDGAYVDTTGTGLESLLPSQDHWSVTFWMKTDLSGADSSDFATILDFAPHQLDIRPIGGFQTGAALYLDNNFIMEAPFPDTLQNDWNHVGLTYDGTQYRFYIDGELAALAPGDPITSVTEIDFGAAGTRGWEGSLDEFRIYHRLLDELDFDNVKNGTASTLTPGLVGYWKFDEGQGQKSFSLFSRVQNQGQNTLGLVNRGQIHFCGAEFDEDRPPVRIAGVTNEDGYYRIEAASYGTGTTFLAHPSKNFYAQRALKFVREEEDYAELPDFGMTEKATLELWINSAGPDGFQTVLSKNWNGNRFEIRLIPAGTDNLVALSLFGAGGGDSSTIGPLGMGYQHLAFTIDSTAGTLQAYKNGELFGSPYTIPSSFGNWTDSLQTWTLGAGRVAGDTTTTNHFGGLIAGLAVYDDVLDQSTIQSHVNNARDPQEPGLRVYFSINEGSGNRLNNQGSVLTGRGHAYGTSWTNFAPNQETTPHVLTPKSRQVTLNPSITSVDQVDFIDRSTVPVEGFVRYSGTDCFAPNVEILVNGESYNPAIFTDSTGRFSIDFDPGTTAELSPKFEDHQFSPASWEVTNVVNPVAGIVFNDVTTRTISGQLYGGLCKKSIIEFPVYNEENEPNGTVATVKISSTDGCYERQYTIPEQNGFYLFENVPPLEDITIALIEHSNPEIKAYFQTEGGVTVDISESDTIVDFAYFSAPNVSISGFEGDLEECLEEILLQQGSPKTLTLGLFEQYEEVMDGSMVDTDMGMCALDTGAIRIINGIADMVLDTFLSPTLNIEITPSDDTIQLKSIQYQFQVGQPNPSPPFLKTLQVIGTSINDQEGEETVQAIVEGIFVKTPTFTTQLFEAPWLILRDPPGDASYAYWEANNKICKYTRFYREWSVGGKVSGFIDLGPDETLLAAPGGVGTGTSIESELGPGFSAEVSYRNVEDNTIEICMSSTEKISTSSSDQFVGPDGDVFVGLGINIQVGLADVVEYNAEECRVDLSTKPSVEPLTPTTFMYSQFQIKNNIIRLLEEAANDPEITTKQKESIMLSVENWNNILATNESLKKDAQLDTLLSFDAGATFEAQITNDTSTTKVLDEFLDVNGEVYFVANGKAGGIGAGLTLGAVTSNTFPLDLDTDSDSKGVSIGYVLADDDIGDAFAVKVGKDARFATPVFELQAGQSSCPWEMGTANREYPSLALAEGSSFSAINIPSKEAAVFQFNLGNISASKEDMTYGLTSIAADNPDGAIIQVNGSTLNGNIIRYTIPFGESIPVTLTVKRGPVAYDYENLRIVLFSECEASKAYGLGIPSGNLNPLFFSAVSLNVSFIRPCSEVDINVPQQNWVVNDLTNASRRITISGYDLNAPDFKLVRVQYRRSDGDGAWINIPELSEKHNKNWYELNGEPVPPEDELLVSSFTQFTWNIDDGLPDGDYEIRAVAVCTGDATDKPGFSEIIQGRIDRQPPTIVGLTEPADGVYHIGDEISATFNKVINCDSAVIGFIPKGINSKPDNGLYVPGINGSLIGNPGVEVTCYENKIIINPTITDNTVVENKVMRVELGSLQDMTGNKITDPITWEFYVDRNELAWLTDSVGITKYEDETSRVSAKVHNRSGSPMPFSIEGAPEWVRVFPDTGYLVPNEVVEIQFEVEGGALALGHFSETIELVTHPGINPSYRGGTEPLRFGTRVINEPPVWDFNPNLFLYSMTYVGELDINGVLSTDTEDRLAAFVDDELRGIAEVTYDAGLDRHLVFLEVFSNDPQASESLEFRIWDASEGSIHAPVSPQDEVFVDNGMRGSRRMPVVFTATSSIEQSYNLNAGVNWISFPLNADILRDVNATLEGLPLKEGDKLLWQNYADDYSNGAWRGALTDHGGFDRQSFYKLLIQEEGSFSYLGAFDSPLEEFIFVWPGDWNWIGFISLERMEVNRALSDYFTFSGDTFLTGDIIKGQRSFAVYEEGLGWGGSLNFLEPTEGYLLRTQDFGILTYPESQAMDGEAAKKLEKARDQQVLLETQVGVDPTRHFENMSIVGTLEACNGSIPGNAAYLAAFAGKKARGVAPLQERDGQLLSYLMVHGEQTEQLSFALLDDNQQLIGELDNHMSFVANDVVGLPSEPYVFELSEACQPLPGLAKENIRNNIQDLRVYPNPFNEQIVVEMKLDQQESVTISLQDVNGRLIDVLFDGEMDAGRQRVVWDAENGKALSTGIYFLHIQSDSVHRIEKMVR